MSLGVQITLNFIKTDEHAQVANNFMCINWRYHQIKSVRGTKCKGLQTATQVGVFPLPSAKQITVIMIIKTKCLTYWHWYRQKFYNWLSVFLEKAQTTSTRESFIVHCRYLDMFIIMRQPCGHRKIGKNTYTVTKWSFSMLQS